MKIDVPQVVWALGDREESTGMRPLYLRQADEEEMTRVGTIDPRYAGPLMAALSKES